MGLLLADHVVVAPVFSLYGRVVRVQVEAAELKLALADLSVPLVRGHLRELEALGPEGVHLAAEVGKVALRIGIGNTYRSHSIKSQRGLAFETIVAIHYTTEVQLRLSSALPKI